jgi:transposase
MIRGIEKEHLERHYAKSRLKDVKLIAIDEIAVRKGHKYMTVVLDLDTGRVIFVGDGRGGDSLSPFWKRLRRSRAVIRAVATDMSPAYIAAVQQALPKASFVFNSDLAAAYFLKEELSDIWEQDDYDTAEGMLLDWIVYAESRQIRELSDFAKTLRRHALGILAYYDAQITTGPLEGLNNKIKTMKRQSYGFRDLDYFKLKILAIHQTRYALVG